MSKPCVIASVKSSTPYYVLFTRGEHGELSEISSTYSTRIDQSVRDSHMVVMKRVRAKTYEQAEEKAKYLLNGGK